MDETATDSSNIRSFRIEVPEAELVDLRERLARTRWTDELPDAGFDYGVPVANVRRLADYWSDGYDWRAWEARLNEHPQFTTTIDGQNIHFLHVRSADPEAFPLILIHGWPGSVVEFLNLIGTLTDAASPSFHLVIPSLPGYGFSGPTTSRGWGTLRTARAFAELMRRLGYERYGVHGNDAGSMIGPELGRLDSDHVAAVHVTQVFSFPSGDPAEFQDLSEDDAAAMQTLQWFFEHKFAFNQVQSQQPQTLAHALADSPAGLLGWNSVLFAPDAMGDRELDADFVLTNVAIYWFTRTTGSSLRFYYEDAAGAAAGERPTEPTTVPLGRVSFAGDFGGVRRFAERDHSNIVQWHDRPEPGGHYAAHLEPEAMSADIRNFFATYR